MSSQSSSGSENSFEIEELLQIRTRCQELRKEKDMLRDSQSQSFELIRSLEAHAKTLYKARAEDEKHIQELERELKNCSQEIDYLQDQLNARNDEELESKEVEIRQSAACIEKLEESISPVSLEYQCEIESMKLDLEQNCFEAKKFKEEAAREKLKMNELIQDFEYQIQDAQKVIECLNEEYKELREKLETSEKNARVFCQKMEEQFEEWLENDGPQLNTQPLSHELEKDVSTCGDILGPLLFRLAVDAALKDKMDKMSCQILEYELLLKQLKEELRAEKLKAKEEAEDLAQEMAELRYQITGLLEEERKRRACIEQISLQRIAELEAQIQREQRKTFSSVKLIHEA
ncbi:uncharacterized protein LOC114310472 isoform X2 [Camellia sinensis]|uniref:uncharacterized protein LOC114310472 isoform X2 n=1 Tax=Camellia sinensis TaxID=4442 RepID=UPI001035AA0D|nr:uncharacterized protein LOC114310472 isoform X2 [Camellia sinensis]